MNRRQLVLGPTAEEIRDHQPECAGRYSNQWVPLYTIDPPWGHLTSNGP